MFKNFASVKTPQSSVFWKNLSNEKRVDLIKIELKKNKETNDFEISKVTDDGQIILKVQKSIPSHIRGVLLLDLEDRIKKNIDKGLTVWLEPVGDKNKLRNLRGIKFLQD